MMMTTAFCFAILAGACGALAYGYRGQRDQEREQITYLRKQLEMRGPLPPNVAALPAPNANQQRGDRTAHQ